MAFDGGVDKIEPSPWNERTAFLNAPMNATSLSNSSLTSLVRDLSGQADNTEIRGRKGGEGAGTVLYQKTKISNPFGSKAVRGEKQAVAREAVKQALVGEFASSKSGFAGKKQVFLELVAKDMRTILGDGPVTLGKVKLVQKRFEEMATLASGITATHAKLNKDADYVRGATNVRESLAGPDGKLPTMEEAIMEYDRLSKTDPMSSEAKLKLGALKAHMDELDCVRKDKSETERAQGLLEKTAISCGATHVEISPQCVALRRIGNEHQQAGLCSALVRLVALEERSVTRPGSEENRMLGKLATETQRAADTGRREETPMARSINGILTKETVTRAQTKVLGRNELMSHKDLSARLKGAPDFEAGKPVYWGLQFFGGASHTIMVGANPGPPENFTFYDPNFGLARFDSAGDLGRFLDVYFEKYGEAYDIARSPTPSGSAPGAKGAFQLGDIVQFDLDAMRGGIPVSLGGLPPAPTHVPPPSEG